MEDDFGMEELDLTDEEPEWEYLELDSQGNIAGFIASDEEEEDEPFDSDDEVVTRQVKTRKKIADSDHQDSTATENEDSDVEEVRKQSEHKLETPRAVRQSTRVAKVSASTSRRKSTSKKQPSPEVISISSEASEAEAEPEPKATPSKTKKGKARATSLPPRERTPSPIPVRDIFSPEPRYEKTWGSTKKIIASEESSSDSDEQVIRPKKRPPTTPTPSKQVPTPQSTPAKSRNSSRNVAVVIQSPSKRKHKTPKKEVIEIDTTSQSDSDLPPARGSPKKRRAIRDSD
jgi:hypothetical protein